ncbi:MAG: tandem-95 repeat protein [Candidatus Accumulibacter similis]|nr:MAG: tandem-95 repeat protein [Candidatus Accumulibacter similis]
MSRNSPVSYRDSAPIGRLLLARIPAACQRAFEAIGRAPGPKDSVASLPGRLLFEALEPRLLLSADLDLAASAQVPQSQPESAYAASSTPLSLSDDAGGGGPAVVRVSGSAASGADWWRLDLRQGDIVSIGVETPNSEMDPYVSLRDASGTEIAADDNSGSGNDAAISQQELLLTGTYYVQVRPAGEGTVSGPYELLVERTRVTEPAPTSLGRSDTSAAMDAASFGAQPAAVLLARWVGGSGNWSDPTHWDIGVAPNDTATETYEVILDLADSPTITIDQDVAVSSLSNSETLVIDGVSLTVAQQTDNSGSIQLAGSGAQLNLSGTVHNTGDVLAGAGRLNLSDATVTVDGTTAQVTAAGAATLNSVDLYAANGGVLSLTGATTFTSRAGGSTIQASGAASKVDLSGLTGLVGGSSGATQISAANGGHVALSGDVDGYTAWTLDGTGGTMDVSGVTELADATVNVSGGAVLAFSAATTLARDSFTASTGGQILFPVATSYTGYNYGDTTIEASGLGSRIDLSHLDSFYGGGEHQSGGYPYPWHYYTTNVNALAGGEIALAGAISHRNNITVDGAGSVLGVTGITKLGGTVLTVNVPGTLSFSSATEVTDSSLTAQTGVVLDFAAATTLRNVNLTATGGGDVLFPVATSYTGYNYGDTTIEASGLGSRIDLSHLDSFYGGGEHQSGGYPYPWHYYTTNVNALAGGEIALAGAISHRNNITVDGVGSVLDVGGVTSVSGASITVQAGNVVTFGSLVSLADVSLYAHDAARILFPVATSYTGYNYGDTTIEASGLGSRIDLSHLDSFYGGGEYQSGGYPYPWYYYTTNVNALAGGEIALAGAISHRNNITVDGAGSVLDVTGITKLGGTVLTVNVPGTLSFSSATEVTDSSLTAQTGVVLDFAAATTLRNVNLTATGGGDILFPVATSYTGYNYGDTTIEASGLGSRIDLSHLDSFYGGGEHQSGGYPYPWYYYTTNVNALAGGEIALAGAISHRNNITVDGVGSVLDVGGVTSVSGASITVQAGNVVTFGSLVSLADVSLYAHDAARILFPVATSYTGYNYGDTTIEASGLGSRIDLSHLDSFYGGGEYQSGGYPYPWYYYTTNVNALAGGEIALAGAISHRNNITVDGAGSVLDVTGITSLNGTALTAAHGAVWTFPAGWHPTWGSGNTFSTAGTGSQFVNRTTLSLSGNSLAINTSDFINAGVLNPEAGGIFDFNGSFRVDDLGILTGVTAGTVNISGDLLGATRNADRYAPQAVVRFDGAGTAASPQQLEVMGRELSDDPTGFSRNFVYGTLELSDNTYLKLVDSSDNAAGTDPEALYTNSLIVADGATLDLNGLQLYTRAAQVSGTSTIIGGSIIQIPDSGPINMANPTPGAISIAGQLDEWSFFARGGQSITVAVDTGGSGVLSPALNWAHVELVDGTGTIIASEDSTAPGQVVTLEDVAIPADGTYRLRIKAPVDHLAQEGNYLATVWDVTADLSPLLLNRQVTGLIENPYSVDQWQFSANAGTQVRFDLVTRSSTGILFALTGPGGWIGFTDVDRDSDLLTLPSDGTYTLAAHGTGGHTGGSYAFQMQQTRVTDLTIGTFQTGQFAGSGQAELFRIDVPTSNPLKVVLDDDASNNVSELYLKFGAPPTRADYDYRFTSSAAPDHEIVVPMAYAGQWYALVYGDTIRTNSSFDISATSSGVYLSGVTPDRYAADATATLTLTGAGFDATTTFSLVAPGATTIPAASVVVGSPTRATANFSLAGLAPGMYSLLASEPGGVSDMLVNGFTVTGAGAGQLDIQLVVPSVLGRQATATLYVDYANTGNEAIPAPLLILSSDDPDGSDRPLMTLDQARVGPGFWTSAVPAGFSSSVQFLTTGSTPGLLQPGETGRIPVYFIGLEGPWDFADRTVEFSVGVARDDGNTVDWNSIGTSIRPDYVRPDAWQAIWSNLISNVGGTWTGYLAALNENASFLGNLGASTSEVSRLFGFELRQAEGLSPIRYLASSTQAAMPAPGPDLVFSQAYAQPISRRFELGPLGRGWANNWQLSLATETGGTVKITDMTGTPRIFEPDRRPPSAGWSQAHAAASLTIPGPAGGPVLNNIRYTAAAGDHGILTSYVGGTFMLTESDGTQYYFRADGKLDFVRDTNDNRINCTYTGALLTGLTHSSGQSLTLAYNGAGRITSVTDSDGRQSLYTYDASNQHLLSVQDYDGRVTSYSYLTGQGAAKDHALSEVAFPDGSHRTYTYDSHGRLASTYRDGGAERITFSYDTAGTVTATDALGNPSQFFFDDWGTILKSTNPLGNSVLLSLDANRNLSSVTDPAGRTSMFQYDSGDNLTRFTDAMGNATSFTYTADFNRLDRLTDANGNLTDYNYDGHGNLTNITYADGSQERWGYDSLGQSTTWTNRRGTPVGFTYNADGEITRKTYADGTHVDYLYDARGNLTSATDVTGTTTLTYDAHDYLTRIDYPGPGGRWLDYTYDSAGRRATSTDQLGHQLFYQFDAVGRLSRITDESSVQVVLYQYDAAGRIALKTLGNGVYTTYDYDAAGQLLHLVNHKSDATLLSRFDYSYDSRGRRISMGTLDGAWTYSYDDIGQLTHAVFASTNPAIPDQDLLYVYDAMGNRIRTVENGVTTAYTTNNLNQYTHVGNTTYAFDVDGNLISETSPSGTVLYSYDDENRLIAVQQGADAWAYTYDAFSQRVAASHNGIAAHYTIDPIGLGNVVGEYDASGSLIAGYDHGFGLLSRTAGGASAWYTFDALGNTAGLIGPSGNLLNSYSYLPFGTFAYHSGTTSNPFRYVAELGVMGDENGLDHMRARYYQSATGRFTQVDPIGILSGDSNLYRYVDNAPSVIVDPSGLKSWQIIPGIPKQYLRWTYDRISKSLGGDLGKIGRIGIGKFHVLLDHKLIPRVAAKWVPIVSPIVAGWGIGEAAGNLIYDILNPDDAGNWVDAFGNPMFPDGPNTPNGPGPGGSGGIPGAVDPNQKLGPSGFGTAGYISPSVTLPYRIDFENDATATAPAQIVTITDQLDPDLDWSTFALTEIGFGDHLITVPTNAQHYETTVPIHYNSQDFDVQIEAGINLATGQVYAHFYSIDPDTSLPPDVLTGFLPPEDGTGRGMGHVSYLIDQKPGLATGTEIRNIALIVFDGQPAIATNQVDPHDPAKGTDPAKEALNTIDAGAPTSSVTALSPTRTRPDFLVQWTATDDAGGSGVASHDIYVSTDGGSYVLWKDDITATSATFTGQAGHSYAFYSVAQDHVGNTEAAPATPDAATQVVDGLAVTAVATDTSGASIRLNRALDPTTLNLYGTETGGQGPADVTLVGAATGAVTGSLVLDDDLQGFRFVRTGGPLAPDTYTLTLRSAANGVIDALGRLLDGDDDGTPGGNYVTTLSVAGPLPRVLSLPDVIRGPGQPVNIPATVSGIPIRLSDGNGVQSIDFSLSYDPALLTISDVTPNVKQLPSGYTFAANLTVPGLIRVGMSFPTPLAAGARDLLTFTAAVPATAPYRVKQVLDLSDLSLNEGRLAAVADDAVHVVAYFGDATGNGSYSSLDGQRVLRHTVRLDSGFAAYPLADPALIADITGNGTVSSLDATRILQEVVGDDQVEIPPLPGITITPPGPDPYVHIPTDLRAIPGSVITVPVLIDDAIGLEAADLRLLYDPTRLEFVVARGGSAGAGATIVTNSTTAGVLTVGLALTTPRPAGGGSILDIEFRVRPTAALGATALNLSHVSLNEDGLVLTPLPVPEPDATDGLLTIHGAGNTAPIAVDDNYVTDEDSPLTIVAPGLLGNDSDVDGDPLTALLVSGPAHGVLSLNTDGSFTYTPAADYLGPDRFTYLANDGQADSNIATVTLTVTPVNDAPVATGDAFTLAEDTPLNVPPSGVLANDSDIDSATLTAALVSGPQHGTLTLGSDGGFTYVPDADYSGPDSFTYLANDRQADSNIATVTLTVTPVNDAPVAMDDAFTPAEDTPLNVMRSGVLANDSDVDSAALTAALVNGPQHGTLSLGSDGGFTYIPDADYFGTDSFTYLANDGQADSNVATVTLTVTPVNDAPVATDDAFTLAEDTPLSVLPSGLLANDSDIDSATLTAALVSGPQHGTLTVGSDGGFTYLPDADYFGPDSFSYVANDGQDDSSVAAVTLTVTPVNDAPVATDDAFTLAEDTPLNVLPSGVLANDSDIDSAALTAALVSGPQHGTLNLGSDGGFMYVPDADYFGTDSFSYLANDGQADSNVALVTLTVMPVNDAPFATDDAFTLAEDTPLSVLPPGVLANDSDIDSATLTAALVSGPQHGALTLGSDGGFTYLPDADYFGTDRFTYLANDGQADSNVATVTLTVTPVNDAPVATDDAFTLAEDTSLSVPPSGVLANDSDIDSATLTAALVSGPQHGTLTLGSDGGLTYVPNADYSGTDSFTYLANDGQADSNVATVTLTATPVNDAPVATDDAFTLAEDTPLSVLPSGVLANDSDIDSAALTAVLVSGPQHGTLNLGSDGGFTYLPDADYSGPDSFTYLAHDGQADSNIATVTLTVTPVNDAPVATDDAFTLSEDTPISVLPSGVLANDTDIDSATLTAALVSGPQHGTLNLGSDGGFTYIPDADYFGPDSFTYLANDSQADSNIATVTLTVTPVNDAPIATDDAFTLAEDTPLSVLPSGVLANDSDIDSATLTAVLVSGPQHGALSLGSDGGFTYVPDADYSGTDSFSYVANDGQIDSNIATVTLTVTPVNDAPVATDDAFTLSEDTPINVLPSGLLANDSDIDSAALTAALVSGPQHGTLTLGSDGGFTYVPDADYSGTDSFSYVAHDGQADSNVATVTLTVTPVNDAPVATDDAFTLAEDTPLSVVLPSGVLANDSDVDSAALTAALVSGPQHGALTLGSDGGFTYLPDADYSGTDSFTYLANDGQADSSVAIVTLTVTPVNDAPVATDDAFTLGEDTPLSVLPSGVLANDSDVDSAALTAVLVSGPQHGALTLGSDGGFTYLPDADYSGTDSFTYLAHDGQADSSVATVTLTVTPVNDAPVATDDAFTLAEDTPLSVLPSGVLADDSDIDSATLTAVLVSGPQHGTLNLGSDGGFTYVPDADYFGPDSFTYLASDGQADSNVATVTLTVAPVNDAPVATDDAFTLAEDTPLSVLPSGVLANDSDIDSAALTAVLVSGPQHGTLNVGSDGGFTYLPDADYSGPDSFSYLAHDGQADSNVATVTLTVTPVNDAPVATDDAFTLSEDTPISVLPSGVLANDSDIDSATLTAALVSGPQHGTLTLGSDGGFTYVPDADYVGPDSFSYVANDGQADSNIATVTLTVTLVNDAPVATGDAFTLAEDTPLNVPPSGVLANDSDIDSATLTAALVSGPQHGALTLGSDGGFTYRPDADYSGTDSFSYLAHDGQADSNIATVTLTVTPVNDAPVATDDAFTLAEDTPLNVPPSGVLANDSDIDSAALTAVLVSGPQHGTLNLGSDGGFTYRPDADYFGPDSFTYLAHDGQADSNIATVTLTVTPVNDAPVATDDAFTLAEDTPLSVLPSGVLANDSDIDSATLTAVLVSGPQHGTLNLGSDGGFTYLPDADYFGPDSFSYLAHDGQADSNIATVTLTVTPVNDAPVATDDAFTLAEDTPLSVPPSGVLANDSDIDSAALTAVLVSGPKHGTLNLGSDGGFTYVPAADYFGPDSFSYVAHDGQADSNIATVTLTVTPVNDAPVAGDDAFTLTEDTPLSVPPPGVLANDYDIDSATLTVALVSGPQHGTLTLGSDSGFTYVPDADYFGADSFSYVAHDGQADSNIATVTLTVTPEALTVSRFTPTSTGFQVGFNRAIDPSVLNLYDTETGGLGVADVTLTGSSGPVKGSIVVDADGKGLTFIRSGGTLAAGTWTARLASGPLAFKDTAGGALDGNGDGSTGDAFSTTFTTSAPVRTLSLPDFMRGPGQFVDLTAPSQTGFLPLYLSDGAGVTSVEFTLHYDPALLDLQTVSSGSGLPAGATVERLPAPDGVLKLRVRSPSALAAGKVHLLDLQAFVPSTAAYGAKQVLDLDEVLVNGQGATDDDALQVVGYFGDTSGDATYTTLDGQQVQRVLVKLDSGFAAYRNVDPLIIADINGSGTLTSIDASRVLQEASFLMGAAGSVDRPEIPPIPVGVGAISFSGPDPRVDVPIDVTADRGAVVTVPVRIDTALGLESAQLRMAYDASRFDLVEVRRGSISGDFGWFIASTEPGRITVDMTRLAALAGGAGTLLDIDLRVRADALPGVSPIDLQYARLNDGHLTLGVVPQPGADETDGRITVAAQAESGHPEVTATPLSAAAPRAERVIGADAWSAAPAIGGPASVAPVIDLAASFSMPAAISEAMAIDSGRKPWLKDYLGNVGQARPASPNAGLKVSVTQPAAIRTAARLGAL